MKGEGRKEGRKAEETEESRGLKIRGRRKGGRLRNEKGRKGD